MYCDKKGTNEGKKFMGDFLVFYFMFTGDIGRTFWRCKHVWIESGGRKQLLYPKKSIPRKCVWLTVEVIRRQGVRSARFWTRTDGSWKQFITPTPTQIISAATNIFRHKPA